MKIIVVLNVMPCNLTATFCHFLRTYCSFFRVEDEILWKSWYLWCMVTRLQNVTIQHTLYFIVLY